MLSHLDHALINAIRQLDEAELAELMDDLERLAGPPDEVQAPRERMQYLRK